MNAHVLKLKLGCIQDVQAHFMEFKALIWVLEKTYDVILIGKEKVFLFIGTLPLRMGCDMACMKFTNVKNMVYYLMSPVGHASYAYLDSCLEDASYDNYDSSFSVDGDAISLCDHDTSDVCSPVSSPPCVEGRGNVCIWDFDHMDGSVESICGQPMVDMDSMPVFDVYDDDERVAPIGDMLMSDMPIWDVESSQEEEPYVDMDAFMAMNVAKAEEEICVIESECEEVEFSMWEAMDASNASTHVSQDLKEVTDVDDWLPGASLYDMHANILDNVFFPPSDVLSWYPDDLWACGLVWDAEMDSDHVCGIVGGTKVPTGDSLDCNQNMACSQNEDYGTFVADDDDDDWGFDEPQIEDNLSMASYVQKAQERLRNLKIQKQAEKTQHVLEKAHSVDVFAQDFEPHAENKAKEHIMADMDTKVLMDACDGKGAMKAGMDAMFDKIVVVHTDGWCMLYPFDPGGCT
ncbi:hypothetical protein L7F22_036160 [Adiantum nelumboides]|nr:hypothetical protein [Adiantum nelumboides]